MLRTTVLSVVAAVTLCVVSLGGVAAATGQHEQGHRSAASSATVPVAGTTADSAVPGEGTWG
ncbi:hypothetical protein [Streptacidiphilus jiangxiensis]|uniref:Uncharacterized protein n=1 Tax=Streptacidiphilus jiangxiensis TaxID=235985 RepID=A0A1H7XM07_STRJI|nr:hypothetical protein [Streptacidiphilus jiangxiensis]SEM34796.1 hypothetical protein SAMN05414137_124106 [Streptacidiphilus jiangxiensis]